MPRHPVHVRRRANTRLFAGGSAVRDSLSAPCNATTRLAARSPIELPSISRRSSWPIMMSNLALRLIRTICVIDG
jgi:hypothetical protein